MHFFSAGPGVFSMGHDLSLYQISDHKGKNNFYTNNQTKEKITDSFVLEWVSYPFAKVRWYALSYNYYIIHNENKVQYIKLWSFSGASWHCKRCVDQRYRVAAAENRALKRSDLFRFKGGQQRRQQQELTPPCDVRYICKLELNWQN